MTKNSKALGGGFRFASLAKKVDAEALLSMEREELADTIIGSHFEANGRGRPNLVHVPPSEGFDYLVARDNANEGFFLIWSGPNGKTNFDVEAYEQCVEEAERASLSPRYHVYGRLFLYQSADVVYYPIPDRILLDFGLDLRGEPYFEA